MRTPTLSLSRFGRQHGVTVAVVGLAAVAASGAAPAHGAAAARASAASTAPSASAASTAPSASAAPSASTVPVSVTPRTGGPGQTFRVSIRRPASTGGPGVLRAHDAVTVSGPRRAGCVSADQVGMPDGPAGARAAVALSPRPWHEGWCRGTFTGTITQTETAHCAPGHACPFLVVAPRTIGRFRLWVS